MTGKVQVAPRAQAERWWSVFPDGTEAEVPLDQVTWEGRAHIKPQ